MDRIEPTPLEIRRRLLAADSAGTEQGHVPVPRRIQRTSDVVGKLPKAGRLRIDRRTTTRIVERSDVVFESISCIDQQNVIPVNELIPIFRLDIGAVGVIWIETFHAHCDDFAFQSNLRAFERLLGDLTESRFQISEKTIEDRIAFEEFDEGADAAGGPGDGSVDPLVREDQRPPHPARSHE